METVIYNIDSNDRNKTSYPSSHNFTYNKVDTTIDSVVRVEPFIVKNIIELNVSNIELPNTFHYINSTKGNNKITIGGSESTIASGSYSKEELMTQLASLADVTSATYSSTTGKVTLNTTGDFSFTNISSYPSLGEILGYVDGETYSSGGVEAPNAMNLPQEPYVFLKINNIGNIIHKDTRYIAKLIPDISTRFDDINREIVYKTLSTKILLDQPIDIKELKVSLIDSGGNLASLNNANFSFNLELKIINNSILKQYEEMKFYNNDVAERLLNARMLEFYTKNTGNNTLTQQYSINSQEQYNNIEFNSTSNRSNYNYNNNAFRNN